MLRPKNEADGLCMKSVSPKIASPRVRPNYLQVTLVTLRPRLCSDYLLAHVERLNRSAFLMQGLLL
jgi:hypothetical protein